MPRLHWTGAGLQPESFELVPPRARIGRRPDNDLVLPFGYVSGHHAELTFDEGQWLIRDLGSTNGTMVNGKDAENIPLANGDRVSLGSLDLRFLTDVDAPAPDPGGETELADERDAFETLANLTPEGGSELEKLSLLLDLQAQWGDGFTADAAIRRILDSSLKVSGAERACLLLRGQEEFKFSAGLDAHGVALEEDRFHASRSVVNKVEGSGEPVFMTQGLEGDLAEQKSIVAMNLRAVGCMPLRRRGSSDAGLLGILYLDSQATMHMLSGLDERILLKLAGEAEAVLERMELIGVREQQKQFERELELARETQEGLLPKRIPEAEGWYLDAFCRPTRHVGGDFYDFIPLPDGRVATMIADVSGKGVAASLVSSSVQGALQMMLRAGGALPGAFRSVNDYLCERSEEGRFVTIFAATLGAEGGVHWSNAGHNPAYLYRKRDGSIEELGATGMILGSLPSEEFGVRHEECDSLLEPGDVLLIYSDGLTEATGPEDELFGEERVLELLRKHAPDNPGELRAKILDAVETFTRGEEQSDDITIVVAARPG
jgi:serine phosphatase RsbU (regulator of sigma subunit)